MIAGEKDVLWYLERFSSYAKILRMMAWVLRFTNNSRRIHASVGGELSAKEISTAELLLCKLAQKESFMGVNDPRLRGLNVFEEKGIMHIKTAVSNRQDTFCFRSYSVGFKALIDEKSYPVYSFETQSRWNRDCNEQSTGEVLDSPVPTDGAFHRSQVYGLPSTRSEEHGSAIYTAARK